MTAPAVSDDPIVGRSLGDFVVRQRIGEGGFGAVYRADQPLLGREAVIKVLHGRHQARPDLIQRFLREAKLASKLDHPYAAHIYAFGAEPDGLLWIAMELVRGTPLDALLERGPLPLDRLVPLVERIAEVVQTAHDEGIVHRDLKPANVMALARAGRILPKLLDFGIAKLVTDAPSSPSRSEPLGETPTTGAETQDFVSVTQAGQVVGSPHYMAPEQWAHGTIGPATDLYALGVLVYEALTGKVPFAGKTLVAIARAHARTMPAPVDAALPSALDAFFTRAVAKRPDDRFRSALELAAALRSASGLATDDAELPRLSRAIEESFVTEAPQPIAEAIASLAAARHVHQAIDAAWMVTTVVVRFVALLALAARAHVRVEADSPAVLDALRALRRRSLRDDEWLELARELCRPFATRRELHPVPELVAFFDDAQSRRLEALLARHTIAPSGTRSDDAHARGVLAQLMPELDRVLAALGFVREYTLGVRAHDATEAWSGVRRRQRVALPSSPLPDGHATLLTQDGAPVVSLWPLVVVAAPIPGAPAELFLFDGQGRSGARHVALPDGYERRDEQIWPWLGANVFLVDAEIEATVVERAPYRGLQTFTSADADLFFGREREIEAMVNTLRTEPFIAVVGPSGAGKSSFVQAGVLPALPDGWTALTLRPGPDPLSSLALRIAREGVALTVDDLRERPDTLASVLRDRAGTLVIVVDQFEEVFTLGAPRADVDAFATALLTAARSSEGSLRVVLTLRDDFLLAAEELPALRARLARCLQLVTTPNVTELERVLVEPARRLGYSFEDRSLPAEMAAEVAMLPSALPLLSFTAAKLWDLRDRQFKRFSREAYRALGGVGGALAQHAEEMLAQLSAEEQRIVRTAFSQLVTSEGTRAVLTRPELVAALGRGPRVESALEKLVNARLLVVSEGARGEERIEVVHETLLSAWPRLVEWRREDEQGARLRDQLRSAAKQWDERGRPVGLLWSGDALGDLVRWRRTFGQNLLPVDDAFAAASVAEARRQRTIRLGAIAVVFTILLVALVVVTSAGRRARRSADDARAHLAELHEEEGRALEVAGDPLRALAYLSAARDEGRRGVAIEFLVGEALRAMKPQLRVLEGHQAMVAALAASADSRRLATGSDDGTAMLWDASSGARIATLSSHRGIVRSVEFSPDSRSVLTAEEGGVARIYDASSGALRVELRGHTRPIFPDGAHFDPTSTRVVTGSDDETVRVWDATSGAPIFTLHGTDGGAKGRFSPDGSLLVTSESGGVVRLWNARTGAMLRALSGHDSSVFNARFSGDGQRIVSAGHDGTVRIWNVRTGALLETLRHSAQPVMDAEFSPDGTLVVTHGFDFTPKLWESATGKLVAELSHPAAVSSAHFTRDGRRVLTTASDGAARLWDVAYGRPLLVLLGHVGEAENAAFTGDGARVLTGGVDTTARLWDITASAYRIEARAHEGPIVRAGYDATGTRMYSIGTDRDFRIWSSSNGAPEASYTAPTGATAGVFANDLSRIAFVVDGKVHVRTLAGRDVVPPLPVDGATIQALNFSADGRSLVAAAGTAGARVWRLGEPGGPRSLMRPGAPVSWAQLSPTDDELLTTSSDGSAAIWDLATARPRTALHGHSLMLNAATFGVGGTRVISASDDKSATVWDSKTGAVVVKLDGTGDELGWSALSPDGALAATYDYSQQVVLWDVLRNRPLAHWSLSLQSGAPTIFDQGNRLEFSRDGRDLVLAGPDGVLRVRSLEGFTGDEGALHDALRCFVPYRLNGSAITPATIDRATCPTRVP